MCIRAQLATPSSLRPWDASRQLITLPDTLPPANITTALRAILTELAMPQPESGAVCWCGADVELLPRVPQQRRSEQVSKRGA